MKKLLIMPLILMAIWGSVFAASADFLINSKWGTVSQNIQIINICDLTDNDLNEIMLGNRPEIAIEFSAQTTLPISFFLIGNLVNLEEYDESFRDVKIVQTFYARRVQQELILSTDLADWKPFLDFITGNALVSLSIQDGKPSIVVGAKVNKRS